MTNVITEGDLLKAWDIWDGDSEKGLRLIRVDGYSMRDDLARFGVIDRLRLALPSDAQLWNGDGAIVRNVYTAYGLRDQVAFVFVSASWPKLTEGDIIPELELRWTIQSRTVIRVDKSRYAVRFENEDENSVDVVIADRPLDSRTAMELDRAKR